ncbi:MAG: hypothetical protein WCL32_23405 [Planctomycetota bacterium]
MASVFGGAGGGAPQTILGVIKAEDVHLKLNGADAIGAIVQQAEWSLERTVNMMYEVGTQNVYYVGDRRKGQAKFSRVVGGSMDFKAIVKFYGDLCKSASNSMELVVGASSCAAVGPGGAAVGGGTISYKMLGVTLTSIGASVTANDIVVTENMNFMFVDMEYT